jgi:hypothetical protein
MRPKNQRLDAMKKKSPRRYLKYQELHPGAVCGVPFGSHLPQA